MAIARQAITKTREFFDSIGMPSHLSELDIDDTHFDVMAMKAAAGGLAYGFVPLDKQDVRRIYEMALNGNNGLMSSSCHQSELTAAVSTVRSKHAIHLSCSIWII